MFFAQHSFRWEACPIFLFKNNLISLVQDQLHPFLYKSTLSLQDTLGKGNGWFLPLNGNTEPKALLATLFINIPSTHRMKNCILVPPHTWNFFDRGQNPFLTLMKSFQNTNNYLGWITVTDMKLIPNFTPFSFCIVFRYENCVWLKVEK